MTRGVRSNYFGTSYGNLGRMHRCDGDKRLTPLWVLAFGVWTSFSFLLLAMHGSRQLMAFSRSGPLERLRSPYRKDQVAHRFRVSLAEGASRMPSSCSLHLNMSDSEILSHLLDRHNLQSVSSDPRGENLFRAVAPQITAFDIAALPRSLAEASVALGEEPLRERWVELSLEERAQYLRNIAMLSTRLFVTSLAGESRCRNLIGKQQISPEDVHARTKELFKGIVKELVSAGRLPGPPPWEHRELCAWVKEFVDRASSIEARHFVVSYAEDYLRLSVLPGHVGGGAEILALASAFRRPFLAYGNDWISRDTVEVDLTERGDSSIQPFFWSPFDGSEGSLPPVRVFQVDGGVSYHMLGCAGTAWAVQQNTDAKSK